MLSLEEKCNGVKSVLEQLEKTIKDKEIYLNTLEYRIGFVVDQNLQAMNKLQTVIKQLCSLQNRIYEATQKLEILNQDIEQKTLQLTSTQKKAKEISRLQNEENFVRNTCLKANKELDLLTQELLNKQFLFDNLEKQINGQQEILEDQRRLISKKTNFNKELDSRKQQLIIDLRELAEYYPLGEEIIKKYITDAMVE